jgi:hypothetical protein
MKPRMKPHMKIDAVPSRVPAAGSPRSFAVLG